MYMCVHLFSTWLSDVQNGRMKISSGCVIELFANRPSRQCYSNSVRLKALIVPLVQSDVPGTCTCTYINQSIQVILYMYTWLC